MAYVLGFFAADGYMIHNKRGAHFVDFYSNDLEIFDLVYSVRDSVALFRLMYHNVTADMFLERKYKTFQKAFQAMNLDAYAGVA